MYAVLGDDFVSRSVLHSKLAAVICVSILGLQIFVLIVRSKWQIDRCDDFQARTDAVKLLASVNYMYPAI